MDISFSTEHEAFREEVREFLELSLTDELRQASEFCPGIFLDYEYNMAWHKVLYEKGWVAPSWPKEYGGTGWDLTQRYIWTTETMLADAPSTAPMGLGMCGPMLIGHGTDEQKSFFLPRILSGEDYWCQGYSEPISGSDLASLKLKASSDGDDLVLNGSKIWTTHAHFANRMFLLVRTDDTGAPQTGITFLLLEMDTPGITVEPIVFASSTHEVNQVFFDNVRVPKQNIVGTENEGWTVAKYLLEFERGGGGSARYQVALRRLRDFVTEFLGNDSDLATKIDETQVKVEAIQYLEFRIMAEISKGGSPGPESSIMKNLGADLGQYVSELMVEALGAYAAIHQPDARVPGSPIPVIGPTSAATAFSRYFNLRASSIAGGTNEVQKNIVAKLVLGL
ncbi:MAG: acyl-CoA dehydrogenase [Pseudomonadales bacterium]|nr:acyl-CoA dehydrogenase [Pseudomonadales bacterium]